MAMKDWLGLSTWAFLARSRCYGRVPFRIGMTPSHAFVGELVRWRSCKTTTRLLFIILS